MGILQEIRSGEYKTNFIKEQLDDIHLQLSLIRDREDCPETITDLIDDIRYKTIFMTDKDNL